MNAVITDLPTCLQFDLATLRRVLILLREYCLINYNEPIVSFVADKILEYLCTEVEGRVALA